MSSTSFLKRAGRGRILKWSLALLLAFVLLLALLPGLEPTAEAAYYDDAIQKLIGWNVLQGYPDGSLNPDSNITRAEFVALINRAYGYDDLTVIPFNDVPGDAWYHDDISAAYAAGYFTGTTTVTAGPSESLTREQALVLLARNMRLEENSGEVTSFSDGRAFQSYSAGYANTAVSKGLVSGYGDGSYRPGNNITRGEMAVMLSRALGNLVNTSGTYELGDVYGNVTINSPSATLRNTTIAGDLYLTGGLGLGGVTLENVRVLGDIIVAGGGESDEGESVILRNVTANCIMVDTLLGEYVSLRAEGDTNIGKALLVSNAYLQDRTPSGMGFQTVRLEGVGKEYTLSGNLEKVVNAAPYSTLRISQGIVKDLTMDEIGRGAVLWLDSSATVLNLTLDTATSVTGRGDVRNLNVNVPGTSTEMLPDKIEIRPGLTGDIAGETMDTTAAAEASSEPHIQAEYPKMINVAATTATATFSTNKSGTVYWAITAISEGSVNEEGLLTPAAQSRILRSGNLAAARSNTVYSANITGLTSGGSYYLSAMLRDARGDCSPVKVVSFTTTDNSTPAFGSGHPYLSEIGDTYAWATVMATKDCQLYWVVFDKGSSAPTAASFRAGAFTGAYGYGVKDVQRNITESFKINNLDNLEELKSYDAYFWLNDPNSAKSSAVRKLSFTTVDRTPPRFNTEPTMAATAGATSLRLTTNVNEAGTVYWVVVEATEEYPKQPNTSIRNIEDPVKRMAAYVEFFKLQIANGMNGLRYGSVKVKADTDATINITGLKAATRYKIYYIAKDNAGNYSDIKIDTRYVDGVADGYRMTSNFLEQSTLDDNEPSVTQDFTKKYLGDPYADTAIQIIFDEAVQRFSTHQTLESMYAAVTAAVNERDADAEKTARRDWAELLRNTIKLYPDTGNDPVKERTFTNENEIGNDWVIDYRYAELSSDSLIVTFPTKTNPNGDPADDSALNLNSDATYHFIITDIADISDRENVVGQSIGSTSIRLPDFNTIAAQVELAELAMGAPRIKTVDGETVDINTAFSMTPVSVSRANPDKNWDMLIWTKDYDVTFKLYTQEQPVGTRPVDNAWELVMTVTNEDGGPQAAVGEITIADYTKFKGVSLWRGMKNSTFNPFLRDEFNAEYNVDLDEPEYFGLKDNRVYYYAIKTETVDSLPAEDWYEDVEFKITVDTGSTSNAFAFARGNNLTEDNYDSAVQKKTITPIGVYGDQGADFIITAPFNEKAAPMFTAGFPKLKPRDTNLEVDLLLERAGTVYCAIAPVAEGFVPTTRLYNDEIVNLGLGSGEDGEDEGDSGGAGTPATPAAPVRYRKSSDVGFDDKDVPTSGAAYNDASGVKFFSGDGWDDDSWLNPWEGDECKWYPLYLDKPNTNAILGQKSSNANIKFKTQEVDGLTPITLKFDNDLTPNTEYFLYVVIMGKTEVSKNVQLFKFKTAETYRPNILLQLPTSLSPTLTSTNTAASVEYALFVMDQLGQSILSKTFASTGSNGMMDQASYDKFEEEFKGKEDENGVEYMKYTVLQAMENGRGVGENNYDSYFDEFASVEAKNQVRRIVTGFPDLSRLEGSISTADVPQNAGTPLTLPDIEMGVNYCIVTVSHDTKATLNELEGKGNSFSFHAASPVLRPNNDRPKLISISGDVNVEYKDGVATYTSDITMYFNTDLYYHLPNSNDRIPVYQRISANPPGNYRLVTELASGSSGLKITRSTDAPPESNTREIHLQIDSSDSGSITLVNDRISSLFSGNLGQIYFFVDLNTSAEGGNVPLKTLTQNDVDLITFNYTPLDEDDDGIVWANPTNTPVIRINVSVKSDEPQVQTITLSESDFELRSGTREVTATVRFNTVSTKSEVVWSVENSDIVKIIGTNPSYYEGAAVNPHGAAQGHSIRLEPGTSGGTTYLTASCGGKTTTCRITVPTSASFTENSVNIELGKTFDLLPLLRHNIPATEIQGNIMWRSDDTGVATVGAYTGFVNTVRAGDCTITATINTKNGDSISTSIAVHVYPRTT